MYTYDCIEEVIIVRTLSNIYGKAGLHSPFWNDKNHAFEYQLDKLGVEKLFQNSDEVIIR